MAQRSTARSESPYLPGREGHWKGYTPEPPLTKMSSGGKWDPYLSGHKPTGESKTPNTSEVIQYHWIAKCVN